MCRLNKLIFVTTRFLRKIRSSNKTFFIILIFHHIKISVSCIILLENSKIGYLYLLIFVVETKKIVREINDL